MITALDGFRRKDKENKWDGEKATGGRGGESQKLIAFTFHPDETFFLMQRGHS
jgi:hypothetical protein